MMYRPGKKKRTAKQLFALLKQKILVYCKRKPKAMVEPNHADVIFPGDLTFKQNKDLIDYGDPSISKTDMIHMQQYLEYDFPLQTYRLKFDNSVLNLLKFSNLFSFSDESLLNNKPLCLASSGSTIVVGWSNGIVMLFQLQNFKNIIWTRMPSQSQISHIQIVQKSVIVSNAENKIILLELIGDQIKIITEYQYAGGEILMIKSLKIKDTTISLISDSEGNFSKLTMKKILLVQSNSLKLITSGIPLVFSVLPKDLFKFYPGMPSNSIIIATNDSVVCNIISLNMSTDESSVLFTLQNFTNYESSKFNKKYVSVEFMQFGSEDQELMVACSFSNRLFFITWSKSKETDNYQFRYSKRVKSKDNIVKTVYLGSRKYLIITESTIYYCLTLNTTQFQLFSNLSQLKTVTLKLNSKFKECNYNKIICVNNQLIWLDGNKVDSCRVLDWKQLYTSISQKQTLYLLYFLIMSKYMNSPYFEKPTTFKGLELCFSKSSIQEKQILLEYYYIMKLPPPEDFAAMDELCQLLLPFIFNHQLDNLSNDQLEYLVKYWEKNEVLMVQEIIMSGIDKGWDIAIKNAWMRALMKIAKMGEDYEFPLLKMCGYFILNEDNQEMAGKYARQIILYMSLGINKNLEQIEDQEEYEDMVKIFIKILLDNEMYLRLAQYKPGKVVNLFTDLFRGQSLQCVLRMAMQGFILSCTGKYPPLIMQRNAVEQIVYSHCIGILSKTYGSQIEYKLIPQQAVLILEGYFTFTKQRTVAILTSLIQNQKLVTKATKIQYKPIELEDEELEVKSQELVLNLLTFIKSNYEMSSEEYIHLLQLCEKSRNLELVSIDIMKSQKRYESILQKYITCKNIKIKEQVFDWLNDLTKQLIIDEEPESDVTRDFNRIVLNRMKQLIHINKQKTREYIQAFFKNSERKLINRIQNDPQLQLEYVELVLETQQNPDKELTDLHISLLCKLDSKRILDVVESNTSKYDLENVLNICLKYPALNTIIIYLYERVGDIDMAVEKHLQLFFDEWMAMKTKRNQALYSNLAGDALRRMNDAIDIKIGNMFQNILRHLQHILEIIHKQPSPLQPYKKVADKLSSIYFMEEQELQATRSDDQMFLDKLTEILGIIIMDLAKQGHMDFLVDEVLGRYKSMSLREMKRHIGDVYSCMLSSTTVIENILQIIRQQLLAMNIQTRTLMSKTVSVQGVCALCQITIMDNETALLFSCGHLYHLQCSESQDEVDYCSECIFSNVISGMIQYPELLLDRLISNRQSRRKFRNVSTIRQQLESKRKHDLATNRKLTKLSIFDKKINELAIQTEIIELRLQTKGYDRS